MGAAFFTDPTSWHARKGAVANSLKSQDVQQRKQAYRPLDIQKQRRRQRENQKLVSGGVSFSPATYERVTRAIRILAGVRRESNPEWWDALAILDRKLDTGMTDAVVLRPSAEEARALAKALRSPGVGGFHGDALNVLERLTELAETPEPNTQPFNLSPVGFLKTLKLVETDESFVAPSRGASRTPVQRLTDGKIYSVLSNIRDPKRFEAAAILRRVMVRLGMPRLHLSGEEAVLLAEVLTALRADPIILSHVNRIAALATPATVA